MNKVAAALAKLAGIRKALSALLEQTARGNARPIGNFSPEQVGHYFTGSLAQLDILRQEIPILFADFTLIETQPKTEMVAPAPNRFGRAQLEDLQRSIEQVFEIRANSELAIPENVDETPRVFISHGRASDWREVQAFIERDVGIPTLELEQEPNLGRTVLQKLNEEVSSCTSAVIVMTGDDLDVDGNTRARENVLHEIGFLQGKVGISAVCLLHQEGTSIPSNIHGLVYIPFTAGHVNAAFGPLNRELKSFYDL